MKTNTKILLVLSTIFIVATAYLCAANTVEIFTKSITGSGRIITQTINAPEYDGIKASRAIQVIITDKATDKITIQADDNLMELVEIKTDDGQLRIGISKEISGVSNTHIKVTVPANKNIRSLVASSAASITSEVTLNADEFEVKASSASKINASITARKCDINASSASKITINVAATECTMDASSASKIDAVLKVTNCIADASSAAKITITGSAKSCKAEISSASSLNASEFAVAEYTISASSGSDANINCTQTLNASASSSASIHYSGDCKEVTRNMSSGGTVRKK